MAAGRCGFDHDGGVLLAALLGELGASLGGGLRLAFNDVDDGPFGICMDERMSVRLIEEILSYTLPAPHFHLRGATVSECGFAKKPLHPCHLRHLVSLLKILSVLGHACRWLQM